MVRSASSTPAAPGQIAVETVPDPRVEHPTDAVVRVTAACICGSDLWPYRRHRRAAGCRAHRPRVRRRGRGGRGRRDDRCAAGDVVIAPFVTSDGTCAPCRAGVQTSCVQGGFWAVRVGGRHVRRRAGQGEAVRVPLRGRDARARVPAAPTTRLVPACSRRPTSWGRATTPRALGGRRPRLDRRGRRRRRGRPVRRHRRPAPRRRAGRDHEPLPRPAGAGPVVGATEVVAERGEEGVALVKDAFGGRPDAVLESSAPPVDAAGLRQPAARRRRRLRRRALRREGADPADVGENKSLRGGIAPVRPTSRSCCPTCCRRHRAGPGLRPDAAAGRRRRGLPGDGRRESVKVAAAALTRDRTRRRPRTLGSGALRASRGGGGNRTRVLRYLNRASPGAAGCAFLGPPGHASKPGTGSATWVHHPPPWPWRVVVLLAMPGPEPEALSG